MALDRSFPIMQVLRYVDLLLSHLIAKGLRLFYLRILCSVRFRTELLNASLNVGEQLVVKISLRHMSIA